MYSRKGTKDIMGHGDRGFCIVLLLFQVIVIINALAINKETRLFPSFPMTAYPLLLSSLSLASFAVHPYHPLPPVPNPHKHPPKCTESHYSKRWSDTGNLFYIQTHISLLLPLFFSERRGEEGRPLTEHHICRILPSRSNRGSILRSYRSVVLPVRWKEWLGQRG
jgi:hypothetical protein